MSRLQVISSATLNYLSNNTFTTIDDLSKIEDELLQIINDEFDAHNIICAKDEKWKKLDALMFSQISDIMRTVFTINLINCSESDARDYDILAVYVDDLILEIVPSLEAKRGIYVSTDDTFRELARFFNYSITNRELNDLLVSLHDRAQRVERCSNRDYIAVNNGIFNYETKQLMPFSADKVFMSKSCVDYNPNATNVVIHNPDDGTDWDVESWMASLAPGDPATCNVLWEISGAVLRPNVRWNKSAWMYSETGNNGKGTLCEMYRAILGKGSYASVPLSDFSKDFALEPLLNASAIIVDENDVGTFIDKAGNLKSIITNDVIQVNRKFKTPIAYQFKGFMVQCLNEYPRIKDKSDSFFRRQLFIPMKACFTGVERKYIKTDYLHRKEVLEYVVKRVLEMTYYTLSEPDSCKEALKEFKELNDPVVVFWEEIKEDLVWDLVPFVFLYDLYKAWFSKNKPAGTMIGKTTFINDLYQLVSKGDDIFYCEDKSRQIFVNKKNMEGPEPLIYEYGLSDWMNKAYKGSNVNMICEPALKAKYAGIQRMQSGGTGANNEEEDS